MRLWLRRWWPALLGAGLVTAALASGPRELGAWLGAPELANIPATVDRVTSLGLNRADIFINDIGFKTWGTYDLAKVRELVRALQGYGVKCSLTTWVRPTLEWARGLETVAGPLAEELGCDLTLDLEEPLTLALKDAAPSVVTEWAERLIGALRRTTSADIAGTCIVYGNLAVLGPFLERCDTIIPQAYATAAYTSKMAPGELERIAVNRFAPFGKRLVLGQAAWNLVGAYGARTPREALTASLRTVARLRVDGVRYWRLGWLYGDVAATIQQEFRA